MPSSPQQSETWAFDSDGHVVEPPSVWTDYLDSRSQELAQSWFWHHSSGDVNITILNNKLVPELSSTGPPRHGMWRPGMTPEAIGASAHVLDFAINPGASNATDRLHDMDSMGVRQALLFPTLFAEYFPLVEHPLAAASLARAYNDWLIDYCAAASDRLYPVAVLPLQSIPDAVDEVKRMAAKGVRAAFIRPLALHDRLPTDQRYWPIWRVAEASEIVMCFHPSAGPAASESVCHAGFVERVTASAGIGYPVAEFVTPPMDNALVLVGMMSEGVLEMFPSIRVAFMHSGSAWLPLALEKIETYLWLSRQTRSVSLDASAVFERSDAFVSFNAGDGSISRMADYYRDKGVWGSRYPNHDTCDVWDTVSGLHANGVSDSTALQLTAGNARRMLGIR